MQVPVYDTPSVAPSALPGVRVQPTTDASGEAAVAQGLQKLGQGVVNFGMAVATAERDSQRQQQAAAAANQEVQRRARTQAQALEATNAETELEQKASYLLHGNSQAGMADPIRVLTPTGQTSGQVTSPWAGLMNMRGTDASEQSGYTLQQLDQERQKIAGQLTTPEARQQFLQSTQGRMVAYHQQIEVHVAQQRQQAMEDGVQARMAIGINDIANNYADPALVESNASSVEKSIRALAPTPEVGEQRAQAWRQKVASTVLNQFVADKDFKGAQAFFSAHAGELGTERAQYEHSIGLLKDNVDAVTTVDKLTAGAVLPSGRHDLAKMESDFQALPAEKRVPGGPLERAFRQQKTVVEEQDRKTLDGLWNQAMDQYMKGGQDVSKVDPVLFTKMEAFDPNTAHKFMKMAESDLAERQRPSKPAPPTDAQKMREWEFEDQLHSDPTAAQGLTVDGLDRQLRDENGHLLVTREQEDRMQRSLAAVHGQKPPPGSLAPELKSRLLQNINAQVPGKDANSKRVRAFVYDAAVDALEKDAKTQKLTGDDVDNMVTKKLLPVPLKGSGWFGTSFREDQVPQGVLEKDPQYKGREADNGEAEQTASSSPAPAESAPTKQPAAPAVPADVAATIRAQYKAKGKDLTDAQVETVYRAHQARKQPAQAARPPQAALVHPVVQQAIQAAPPGPVSVGPVTFTPEKSTDGFTKYRLGWAAPPAPPAEPEKPKEPPRPLRSYSVTKG